MRWEEPAGEREKTSKADSFGPAWNVIARQRLTYVIST